MKETLYLNKPLALVYHMKQEMRPFWKLSAKEEKERIISNRLTLALSSGIEISVKLANTIAIHTFGILDWYDTQFHLDELKGRTT